MIGNTARIFAGTKARALRLRLGLGQSAMAARIGISVSYLSQIESDDRPMTAGVLSAFARAFPLDWAEVSPDEEVMLYARALAAVQDSGVAAPPQGLHLSDEALHKAIRRQPRLAERLVAIHEAYARAQEQLRTLDDAYERDGPGARPLPWEEVRDWFHSRGNYIDALDRLAEQTWPALAEAEALEPSRIEQRLAAHGVVVRRLKGSASRTMLRHFDPDTRTLALDRSLPPPSQLFLMAYQLVRLEMAEAIDHEVAQAGLGSAESRKLLSVGLSNYAAGALLMPYDRFRRAARAARHDVEALADVFGTSFEQVCHRLSTLQRPGAAGVPFFFCRVDMAGNITKRHSATRLQFARYGGACPLWIVHEAVAIPDRILVQLAEMPDGTRYVSMAKGLVKPSGTYLRPGRRYAVALGCEVSHLDRFVYSDELDLAGARGATPIGISCRICPRDDCDQRAFPPAGRTITIDPDVRAVVPYDFV